MDPVRHQQFAEQFVLHQGRVYGYIVTMLPNRHDAEDVFQQTSLILWQKWDQFDPSRDFVGWACGIAHHEVRNFLRRRGNDRVVLSEKVLDELADLRIESQPMLEQRRDTLVECMKKLDFVCREMLERCYAARASVKSVAKQFRMTPNALYLRLRRIRRDLLECVHRTMTESPAIEGWQATPPHAEREECGEGLP
jgi:RNA polymerase sigma-70 factor (ECF subfamily)